MIICSTSNIDLIHGAIGYGNVSDGTTDWRITNTKTAIVGQTGILNILNSTSSNPNFSIIENGNIGIGTAPNISNKLILYNDNTNLTSLSITNNLNSNIVNTSPPFTASFPTGTAPTTHLQVTDTPTDRYMIFTTASVNHTFTIPAGGLNCDILMIGGGGFGDIKSGGGAGACIIAINQTLPAGSCIVNVGSGAGPGSIIGRDSFISVNNADRYRAKGGGGGGYNNNSGLIGGCGGGAENNTSSTTNGGLPSFENIVNGSTATIGPSITSTYAVMGNAGADNIAINTRAGGGGIGNTPPAGGAGGNGAYQITLTGASTPINFRNYFANGSTSFGVQDGITGNYYIGGGGSGGFSFLGGLGGGGGSNNNNGGVSNTGSGGAGYLNGGSGIIIIRYRTINTILTPISGNPSIELIRGTTGDK